MFFCTNDNHSFIKISSCSVKCLLSFTRASSPNDLSVAFTRVFTCSFVLSVYVVFILFILSQFKLIVPTFHKPQRIPLQIKRHQEICAIVKINHHPPFAFIKRKIENAVVNKFHTFNVVCHSCIFSGGFYTPSFLFCVVR